MRERLLTAAVLLASLLCVQVSCIEDLQDFMAAQQELLRLAGPQPNAQCAALSTERLRGLNLTAKERAVLPSICWQEPAGSSWATNAPVIPSSADRGIPEDVSCRVTHWCAGHMLLWLQTQLC